MRISTNLNSNRGPDHFLPSGEEWGSITAVARILGVSRPTAVRIIADGRIGTKRLYSGGHASFNLPDARRLAAESVVPAVRPVGAQQQAG